jgi:hypothetical protein
VRATGFDPWPLKVVRLLLKLLALRTTLALPASSAKSWPSPIVRS